MIFEYNNSNYSFYLLGTFYRTYFLEYIYKLPNCITHKLCFYFLSLRIQYHHNMAKTILASLLLWVRDPVSSTDLCPGTTELESISCSFKVKSLLENWNLFQYRQAIDQECLSHVLQKLEVISARAGGLSTFQRLLHCCLYLWCVSISGLLCQISA